VLASTRAAGAEGGEEPVGEVPTGARNREGCARNRSEGRQKPRSSAKEVGNPQNGNEAGKREGDAQPDEAAARDRGSDPPRRGHGGVLTKHSLL